MISYSVLNIGELITKRDENKLIFSLETNPQKFRKILTIFYLVIFGYMDITQAIPNWIDGTLSFVDLLIINAIFLGMSLFFLYISPILVKFVNSNIHKTANFICLDKSTGKLYFRFEDISFDIASIKEIRLAENNNVFGLTYHLEVITKDITKRMMPPLQFKFANEIKDTLNKELVGKPST